VAYTVNRTSGATLTTIADGTIDSTTDLVLIGKNYSGYGELLNENYVKLLENFSAADQPASPLSGQLWWDSFNNLLKVYTGSAFKVVAGATSSSVAPSGGSAGDQWFDNVSEQLYVYNGSSWVLIGPSFTSVTGTSGAVVETIADTLGSNHVIVKLFVNEDIVGIISKDSVFTPASAVTGFANINPGIQLSTAVSGATFKGTATNADLLDNLNSTQFLRSDTNTTLSGGILAVAHDPGISVGAGGDFTVNITAGVNVNLANATADGDFIVNVNRSSGGVLAALAIDGATGYVSLGRSPVNGNDSLNVATTAWCYDNVITRDGAVTMNGDFVPATNLTYDLGTVSFKWDNVWAETLNGTAISALYADLAERFEADAAYVPGTVVELGGSAEVTAVADELSESVFGVVSGKAAYLMNSGAGDNDTHPAIAMTGRVPVRVIGTVMKGQRLVSAGNGVARGAAPGEANSFNTIGRALVDKLTVEEGSILAVVKIN